MDNEILQQILSELKGLKQGQADVKTEIADVKTEMADMKTEMADMKTEIADVKTEMAASIALNSRQRNSGRT